MQALKDAVETSGTFMLIIAIAGFFTWIITKEGLATVLQNMLSPLYSAGPVFVLLVLAVILVIVGCFMDTTAAILLITPIFMPIINNLGLDQVHFGVMMTVALISGIVTPPFGICRDKRVCQVSSCNVPCTAADHFLSGAVHLAAESVLFLIVTRYVIYMLSDILHNIRQHFFMLLSFLLQK